MSRNTSGLGGDKGGLDSIKEVKEEEEMKDKSHRDSNRQDKDAPAGAANQNSKPDDDSINERGDLEVDDAPDKNEQILAKKADVSSSKD
jgi:hypothetical protein